MRGCVTRSRLVGIAVVCRYRIYVRRHDNKSLDGLISCYTSRYQLISLNCDRDYNAYDVIRVPRAAM